MTSRENFGNPVTLVNAAALAATYTASDSIDLSKFNSVAIFPKVTGVSEAAKYLSLLPEWSHDGTDWHAENDMASQGTASATEQPYNQLALRKDYPPMSVGKLAANRFNRIARFFRVSVKEKAGSTTTTALLTVLAVPMNN